MVNGFGSRCTKRWPQVGGCILALALTILGGCATGSDTAALSMADGGPSISAPLRLAQNTDSAAGEAQEEWSEASEADEDWDDEEWADEDWEDEEDAAAIADPLMPFNKAMFHLTDNLYYGVFQPVGGAYKFLVPLPIRSGLKNFFTNLAFPIRFVNCLLQGKGEAAEREIDRFAMNTVVGVLGFGDPAKKYPELALNEEDFGQTLGVWGAGHGIYIYWPIFGPSTLRETVGLVGDIALAPTTYLLSSRASLALAAGQRINTLSFHIGDYEALKEAAFDPYSAFRDAYLQLRAAKLAQ
jgi:phospholipid-binding lipoprotein MlaA